MSAPEPIIRDEEATEVAARPRLELVPAPAEIDCRIHHVA